MYLADTGLFVTLMFIDQLAAENTLYAKLLADKLPANLGYLYENAVAQMITSTDRELYYHTWKKDQNHYYEIDFLTTDKDQLNVIEVKSSGVGNHASITNFAKNIQNTLKTVISFRKRMFHHKMA